jgi:hypothetical protein
MASQPLPRERLRAGRGSVRTEKKEHRREEKKTDRKPTMETCKSEGKMRRYQPRTLRGGKERTNVLSDRPRVDVNGNPVPMLFESLGVAEEDNESAVKEARHLEGENTDAGHRREGLDDDDWRKGSAGSAGGSWK